MDRKLNVLFTFLAVFVFITNAENAPYYWGIILGVILSFLFALVAFAFNKLTLDGIFAATVVGTFIFGIGGWPAALIVLIFFISSVLVSGRHPQPGKEEFDSDRRNGLQVWANGFWLVVCLVLANNFTSSIFLVGGLAAIATATADTWATELRSVAYDSTYLITTFEPVDPGTDGGVSLKGTCWAFAGSVLIGSSSAYFFSLQLSSFFFILTAGFLGCLLDSYLGATFQQKNRPEIISFSGLHIQIDNNMVNALSTGAGALLAIILKTVIT